MGGSISGANVVAKMVNEDVEAEVVTLEGGKELAFRYTAVNTPVAVRIHL